MGADNKERYTCVGIGHYGNMVSSDRIVDVSCAQNSVGPYNNLIDQSCLPSRTDCRVSGIGTDINRSCIKFEGS